MSLSVDAPAGEALDVLSRFQAEFYDCLYARADALFEHTDAVLRADGPVKTLVELSPAVEHRRGHGALYAALDRGWLEPTRLRRTLAGLPLPKAADGRIVLAVDVSNWLRPGAPTSDDRLFCHVYGRGDRSSDQMVPGWPYPFAAALEAGRTSWVGLLDAVRLGPADDATLVTATQLRDVVERLTSVMLRDAGRPRLRHALSLLRAGSLENSHPRRSQGMPSSWGRFQAFTVPVRSNQRGGAARSGRARGYGANPPQRIAGCYTLGV